MAAMARPPTTVLLAKRGHTPLEKLILSSPVSARGIGLEQVAAVDPVTLATARSAILPMAALPAAAKGATTPATMAPQHKPE